MVLSLPVVTKSESPKDKQPKCISAAKPKLTRNVILGTVTYYLVVLPLSPNELLILKKLMVQCHLGENSISIINLHSTKILERPKPSNLTFLAEKLPIKRVKNLYLEPDCLWQ